MIATDIWHPIDTYPYEKQTGAEDFVITYKRTLPPEPYILDIMDVQGKIINRTTSEKKLNDPFTLAYRLHIPKKHEEAVLVIFNKADKLPVTVTFGTNIERVCTIPHEVVIPGTLTYEVPYV